eukprot:gene5885-9713_t
MFDQSLSTFNKQNTTEQKTEKKSKDYEKRSERIPRAPKKKKYFAKKETEERVSNIYNHLNKVLYFIPNILEKELNKHTKKLRSTGVVRPEDRRSTLEVLIALSEKAEGFLKFSLIKQITLSFYSGIYVCSGVMLSVYLSTGMPYYGIQRLLMAVGLCSGLIMSSLTGSALFTEQNVILPVNYVKFRRSLFKTIRFWLVSFIGNCAGCAFMGVMFNISLAVRSKEVQDRLSYVLEYKLHHMEYGRYGWWGILLSGNMILGTGVILSNMSKDVPGKVIAMFVGVVSFVATGVDHCVANIGFFSIGLIHQSFFSESLNVPTLTISNSVLWNIIPTGIGNMIGSFVFVSAAYSFLFSSDHVVKKLAKQNGEVKKEEKNTAKRKTDSSAMYSPYAFSERESVALPPPKGKTLSRTINNRTFQTQSFQQTGSITRFSEIQTEEDKEIKTNVLFKKLEKMAKEKKNASVPKKSIEIELKEIETRESKEMKKEQNMEEQKKKDENLVESSPEKKIDSSPKIDTLEIKVDEINDIDRNDEENIDEIIEM